jgi:hypothetical protein
MKILVQSSDCFGRWWTWLLQPGQLEGNSRLQPLASERALEKGGEPLVVQCPVCRKIILPSDVAHVREFLTAGIPQEMVWQHSYVLCVNCFLLLVIKPSANKRKHCFVDHSSITANMCVLYLSTRSQVCTFSPQPRSGNDPLSLGSLE